jgi:16S rRNA (uracil1498-N3)-methyltransferase
MTQPRVFQAIPLKSQTRLELDLAASHHLANVLRVKAGDAITLFNGEGGEYAASITQVEKKKVIVSIGEFQNRNAESPLTLCLAQGISRGEKMDYTIQKAVELGVNQIIPLLTERCTVKLDAERRVKRWQHWQSIVHSACEQSGRTRLPELLPPQTLVQWLPTVNAAMRLVLAPTAPQKLHEMAVPDGKVMLLIGPEGGLTELEIGQAQQHNFHPLNLGPRILRTETAAVAALTVLQTIFGDMVR